MMFKRLILIYNYIQVIFFKKAICANWAQVSGDIQTNIAITSGTPWTARWGHSVAALDYTKEYMLATGQKSRIFVIGGENHLQASSLKDGDLKAYPGGGGFKNDVWMTTGIDWKISNNLLKKTKWGDPLPQLVANMKWIQTNKGKKPPGNITYYEWISCSFAPWSKVPPTNCSNSNDPPGSYLADAMFSPRRNFVSLVFMNTLYVIGGRAREIHLVSDDQLRGGVYGPYKAIWREFTVLKNDVWKSTDAGASWTLVTPGCLMPQIELIHKSGQKKFECFNNKDCEGDSYCYHAPKYPLVAGTCVCNMWSPRENHAVTIHNNYLYLSGGYASIDEGNCGSERNIRPSGEEYSCGANYRRYMNDIWRSKDGKIWEQLIFEANWLPRGEHGMVSFNGILYILGGRMGESTSDKQMVVNDIWQSKDGNKWTEVLLKEPKWSPRAKHVVVAISTKNNTKGSIYLIHGEDDENILNDVWTWDGIGKNWIQDYGPTTKTSRYLDIYSNLSLINSIPENDWKIMLSENITTINDLLSASLDIIIKLRKSIPICDYKALVKEIMSQCAIQGKDYDGKDFENIKVIQGKYGEINAEKEKAVESANEIAKKWDGCTHIGSQYLDSITNRLKWPLVNGYEQVDTVKEPFNDAQTNICKWKPTSRTSHSGVVFQDKIFVIGGKIDTKSFTNDVWYRDDKLPISQFSRVPGSLTSDTIFKFQCDEPGCLFEYYIIDMIEMLVIRNWTLSGSEIDYFSWLNGGNYELCVRAIDPAGNKDEKFDLGRNIYRWTYIPTLPWGLILGLLAAFIVISIIIFYEWRRRRKKAALEKYAMKRMRRKLKGVEKGGNKDVDWHNAYDDARSGKNKVLPLDKTELKTKKKKTDKSKNKDNNNIDETNHLNKKKKKKDSKNTQDKSKDKDSEKSEIKKKKKSNSTMKDKKTDNVIENKSKQKDDKKTKDKIKDKKIK